MEDPRLLIYDDGQGHWGPMTDLRPVFEIRTGALTHRQRIERKLDRIADAVIVPEALADLVAENESAAEVNPALGDGSWLIINGRWSGIVAGDRVRDLPLGRGLIQEDGQVVALHLDRGHATALINSGFQSIPEGAAIERLPENVLLERPWHILDELDMTLRDDLDGFDLPCPRVEEHGAAAFGDHKVMIAPDVVLQPRVVFNTQLGPIVIDHGAMIGALSVLEGPCYIGRDCVVNCQTHIRPHTVVGPVCKVAGEISHTVIQGYSNKGHHGYLGHSLVGQWVNLGAATNASNLKNTYGEIRIELEEDHPEATGRIYHGPILGDYTRTAIGTRLLTGSCIGTGSMIARSVYCPKSVDRFSFVTDSGIERYDIDKFLATARVMMARRGRDLTPSLEARLNQLQSGGGWEHPASGFVTYSSN